MRPRWPLPIGRDQVDDPRRHVRGVGRGLEPERLVGEQRREVLEPAAAPGLVGIDAVDLVDAQQGRVLLVAHGRAAGPGHVVTLAQPELPHLLDRHVDVVLRRQVAAHPEEAVALVAQVEEALDGDGLARELLGGALLVLAPAAAAPAPAVAGLVVVTPLVVAPLVVAPGVVARGLGLGLVAARPAIAPAVALVAARPAVGLVGRAGITAPRGPRGRRAVAGLGLGAGLGLVPGLDLGVGQPSVARRRAGDGRVHDVGRPPELELPLGRRLVGPVGLVVAGGTGRTVRCRVIGCAGRGVTTVRRHGLGAVGGRGVGRPAVLGLAARVLAAARRLDAGQLEDELHDLGLAGARRRLGSEGLGDGRQLLAVLPLEGGPFEGAWLHAHRWCHLTAFRGRPVDGRDRRAPAETGCAAESAGSESGRSACARGRGASINRNDAVAPPNRTRTP